jgi:anti-sigma regulatory factor (Ser/Thr protein kinase)
MTGDPRSARTGAAPGAAPGAASGPVPGAPGPAAPVLDQAFDADSLYALRAAVAAHAAHAAQAGLPQHRADDLVVAAHELAANAILHGAGHGRLRLWQQEQALQCQVTDDGAPEAAGAGPDAEPAPRDPARWHCERGHGLWLVREVADEVSLRSGPGGTVATISFTLRPPG